MIETQRINKTTSLAVLSLTNKYRLDSIFVHNDINEESGITP